jgi:O-antigen/teichoic acid export membrane protein
MHDTRQRATYTESLLRFFMLSVGFAGLRFLLVPVRIRLLTTLLTKAQYGSMTLITMSVAFAAMVSSLGSFEFMVRRIPGSSTDYQKAVLKSVIRFFGLLSIVLAIVGFVVFRVFKQTKIEMSTYDLAAAAIGLVLTVHLMHRIFFLLGRGEIARVRISQVLYSDLWFLPVLAVAPFVKVDISLVLWAWAGWLLLTIIATWRWVPVLSSLSSSVSAVPARVILRFGLPLMPMILGEWLFRLGDRYVLLGLRDLTAVANYSLCMNIALIVYIAGSSVLDILVPEFNKVRNRVAGVSLEEIVAVPRLRSLFTLMIRYAFLLSIVGGAALALLGPQILNVLSGPAFRDAAFILPWTAPAPFFFLVSVVFTRTLIAMERGKLVGFLTLSAAALNVGLNILFVPRWAERGAALATCLSLALLAVFTGHACRWWKWISWRELRAPGLLALGASAGAGFFVMTRYTGFDSLIVLLGAGLWSLLWIFVLRLISLTDMTMMSGAEEQ